MPKILSHTRYRMGVQGPAKGDLLTVDQEVVKN